MLRYATPFSYKPIPYKTTALYYYYYYYIDISGTFGEIIRGEKIYYYNNNNNTLFLYLLQYSTEHARFSRCYTT